MKPQNISLVIAATSLIASCAAPVNSTFEGARNLKKGQVELAGNYSSYSFSYDGESEKTNNNYGLRLGVGISERADMKIKYESINPPATYDDEGSSSISYLALTPKYSFIEDKFSGSFTVGAYFSEGETSYFFGPKFLVSFPVENKFEPTFTVKTDIFPEDESYLLGLTVGFGISNDLNHWALRPEFGLMKDLDDMEGSYTTWGVGLTYNITSQ